MADSDAPTPIEGDAALIAALAAGATQAEAASRSSVSERTVRRRWAEPAFRARVDAVQAELVSEALRLERAAIVKLVRERMPAVLAEVMAGESSTPMTKLKALEFALSRLDRAERAALGRDLLGQIVPRLDALELALDARRAA